LFNVNWFYVSGDVSFVQFPVIISTKFFSSI